MAALAPRTTCLCSSVFHTELEALQAWGRLDMDILCFDPGPDPLARDQRRKLHRIIAERLDQGHCVVLLYGDCHANMISDIDLPGIGRVHGADSAEILLGHQIHQALRDDGAYFLLPEWALRWRQIMQFNLGLDDESAVAVMTETYRKLVYLNTGAAPVPTDELNAASRFVGLPHEVLPVSLDHLLSGVRRAQRDAAA